MNHCRVCALRTLGLTLATPPPPQLQPLLRYRTPNLNLNPRRTLVTAHSSSTPQKKEKEKVLVISGPTGAGKSRLALELAKRLNGEIISADSVQVYRGLDVGSAKPSFSDRKEVPHHLLDILHPSEDYSVGQFFEDARQVTNSVLENGHVPIVVGGTGLYLRWYMYGKPEVPKASPEVASEAYSEIIDLERDGNWDAAVKLVVEAGDPGALRLACNDWYRLRRSLEILKSSGSPPSAFQVPYDSFRDQINLQKSESSPDVNLSGGEVELNISQDLDYDFICFFLSNQRLDLYRMIDLRCEDMLSGVRGRERGNIRGGGEVGDGGAVVFGSGELVAETGGGNGGYGVPITVSGTRWKLSRRILFIFVRVSKSFKDKVVDFIYEAYHKQTGNVVVPKSFAMEKDLSSRREVAELKSYRPKNSRMASRIEVRRVAFLRHWRSNKMPLGTGP
ncbi:hypothetical protein Sjap_025902 [Stephania japonica]|uniref:tRNA dimethylallyltransferase n=1 Tax=Stephania japonica TaxID=461633 RepID=A0AAP0E2M5_9MAGN